MKLPIIGITSRVIINENSKINKVPNNIISYIIKNNAIPIIIPIMDNNKLDYIISKFDGFIIPGGNTFTKTDEYIIKYAIDNDIPLIGICAGMQAIGNIKYFGTKNSDHSIQIADDNHYKTTHSIKINNGLLKDILNKDKITVNSRHYEQILKEEYFEIDAMSSDNIIEAIHIPNKKCILGLQWHPEDLEDDNSNEIFKYFINKCKEKEK